MTTYRDADLETEHDPLACGCRFSVFALGSRAYPHFAAFGHYMNKIMMELGAECIHPIVEGDELCGQEESFRNWAEAVFKVADSCVCVCACACVCGGCVRACLCACVRACVYVSE